MCILVVSSEDPQYPFILLSNRDEYLDRPTNKAEFWHFDDTVQQNDILAPYDLARPGHGTWIAISKAAHRVAVLLNYQEKGDEKAYQGFASPISRGVLAKKFVSEGNSLDAFQDQIAQQQELSQVAGFQLIFGNFADGELRLLSNRVQPMSVLRPGIPDTLSVSNVEPQNEWPKSKLAVKLLRAYLQDRDTTISTNQLVNDLLNIMSTDTFPRDDSDSSPEKQYLHFRQTIFVPLVESQYGTYGTRTQTVFLVSKTGNVTYHEKDVMSGEIQSFSWKI